MSNPFGELPQAAPPSMVVPFTANVEEEKLQEFKSLLKLSKLPPPTFEGLQEDRRYGVTAKWMKEAKDYWLNKFDWRTSEKHINSFPNFKATVEDDDGSKYQIHFAALFSKNPKAIPLIAVHGWPGSFLEFLPMMKLLMTQYTPQTLPFHFINPSMIGYGYSSPPPLDRNWRAFETSKLLHKLMLLLGFDSYVAQGGDIGSVVARILGGKFSENCKAVHLNFVVIDPPEPYSTSTSADEIANKEGLNDLYRQGLKRKENFFRTGYAYAMEHGTRTSTIGHVLASNPLSLLAWIGEKFLEWSDTDPTLDEILESVTLWWLNETQPTAIYPYRANYEGTAVGLTHRDLKLEVPFGFSWFPKELAAVPESWVKTTGNLVYFKQHDSGGHFAAFEKPDVLLKDIIEFVDIAKEKGATF